MRMSPTLHTIYKIPIITIHTNTLTPTNKLISSTHNPHYYLTLTQQHINTHHQSLLTHDHHYYHFPHTTHTHTPLTTTKLLPHAHPLTAGTEVAKTNATPHKNQYQHKQRKNYQPTTQLQPSIPLIRLPMLRHSTKHTH